MKSRPAKQIVHKRTKKVATVEDLLNTDERKALAYNLRVATVDFMEKGVVLSKYAERVRCFPVPLAQMALNYIYFSNGVFPDDVPSEAIDYAFAAWTMGNAMKEVMATGMDKFCAIQITRDLLCDPRVVPVLPLKFS